MRQSRERRRNAVRIIPLEVKDSGIEILARKGYLRPEQRNDPEAIRHALGQGTLLAFHQRRVVTRTALQG
jgi:hypothetical protein